MSKDFLKYKHTREVDNPVAPDIVAPQLMDWFNPKSVVDVGCGLGSWLKGFQNLGVAEIVGLDGDHLNRDLLVIPDQCVISHDLEQPYRHPSSFDLVISLEVAEHLSAEKAEVYVDNLVNLGDVILFSAAIPFQGGQNHINEQWVEYWQGLFEKRSYHFYDEVRPLFWNNENIDWYYRQNMFLVIKEDYEHSFKKNQAILNLVHPALFTKRMRQLSLYQNKMGLVEVSIIWLRLFADKLGLLSIWRKFF